MVKTLNIAAVMRLYAYQIEIKANPTIFERRHKRVFSI